MARRWSATSASAQDPDDPERWTIIQKQSGADRFSLGGTVSANGHGRGLTLAPIVADVEAMTVVGTDGRLRVVDRTTIRSASRSSAAATGSSA